MWLAKTEKSGNIIQCVGYVIDFDAGMSEVVVPSNPTLNGFYVSPSSIGCQRSDLKWRIEIVQNVMVRVSKKKFKMFVMSNGVTYNTKDDGSIIYIGSKST